MLPVALRPNHAYCREPSAGVHGSTRQSTALRCRLAFGVPDEHLSFLRNAGSMSGPGNPASGVPDEHPLFFRNAGWRTRPKMLGYASEGAEAEAALNR